MNKKVFTIKDDNGNDVELAIKKPTAEIRVDSKLVYNREWKKAVESGSMLKRNMKVKAIELGLWNDEKEERNKAVSDELRNAEIKLKGQALNFSSKDEAREFALHMRKLRNELLELNFAKDDLYPLTAEAYADEAQTKFMVSQCCIYNDSGKRYFKSYEDFLSKSETEVGLLAIHNYTLLNYEYLNDVQSDWQENIFLKKYKFIDEQYRLIDEDGNLISSDGRRINENGFYVNDQNQIIDNDGNAIDENGNYIVDSKDFD